MELRTFDEILIDVCDGFDKLIAPKTMYRGNSNILYLIFKAFSKGLEVINNVVWFLSNKFNPFYCSEEDLVSVSHLTGTDIIKATCSGLQIIATNTGLEPEILSVGKYVFKYSEDVSFEFEVINDVEIAKGEQKTFIAMSSRVGKFEISSISSISVTSDVDIPPQVLFSCKENSNLIGREEETKAEFRKRITTDNTRQEAFSLLEQDIKKLPYIFDCKIKYNQTLDDVLYDGIVIPPMTAIIFYTGELKRELAEIVCSHIVCPTVKLPNSVAIPFKSPIFANGEHLVFFTPFMNIEFSVEVKYVVQEDFANEAQFKKDMSSHLFIKFSEPVHTDFVKESDVYNAVNEVLFQGIIILSVKLFVDGENVKYVNVPVSKVATLKNVSFNKG